MLNLDEKAELIGKKIKLLRAERKITQRKLAQMIGAKQAEISRWELGKSMISLKNLILLSEIFNVSLDEFIREDRKEDEEYKNLKEQVSKIEQKIERIEQQFNINNNRDIILNTGKKT